MYQLTQIKPRIFLLTFKDEYELAMHFLRAQEFYESPNENFRNTQFRILDYIDWYAKEHDSVFSYAKDWEGFNIPSWVLDTLYSPTSLVQDMNARDRVMQQLRNLLSLISEGKAFYLLGTMDGDKETLKHEIAHALWHTNDLYHVNQFDNLTAMQTEERQKLKELLHEAGYDKTVLGDEAQAYLSTGTHSDLGYTQKQWDKIAIPFRKTFKKFYE